MENGTPVAGSDYIYAPNQGAPVFFAVAFAASTLCHLWQAYHFKCFKLTPLFPICCVLFTAGFAVREYGAFNYGNLNVYIASTILIYFAPPLLELQNYHILGRILYYVPYKSPLHPGRVLTTFGMLSSVVEILNALGVTYSSNSGLSQKIISLGSALMKASLALQVVVVVLFYVLAGYFHVRCARAGLNTRQVRTPLLTLYASSFLIFTRTVYRMVEYFGFSDIGGGGSGAHPVTLSPVLRYEWFFYVFEASLMLANVVLWNVFHPRRYLPASNRIYLARDGVTEVDGPGWDDKRPWFVTLMDPFGCVRMENEGKAEFWDVPASGSEHNSARQEGV